MNGRPSFLFAQGLNCCEFAHAHVKTTIKAKTTWDSDANDFLLTVPKTQEGIPLTLPPKILLHSIVSDRGGPGRNLQEEEGGKGIRF